MYQTWRNRFGLKVSARAGERSRMAQVTTVKSLNLFMLTGMQWWGCVFLLHSHSYHLYFFEPTKTHLDNLRSSPVKIVKSLLLICLYAVLSFGNSIKIITDMIENYHLHVEAKTGGPIVLLLHFLGFIMILY